MIRYDSAYNQEISRVVSNFNRKVRRLEKAETRLLPSPVSVKEIKSTFTNRRDLNKYLNDLRLFGKRGAEEIVTIKGKEYSNYQIALFKSYLRRERAAVRRDIERAENIQHRYPMQHDIYLQNLRVKREKLSQAWADQIERNYKNTMKEYYRKTTIFDSYLDALFEDAYQTGFDLTKLTYIRNKLLQLTPDQFIQILEDTPEIKFIFNYYHALTRQDGYISPDADSAFNVLYERIDEIVNQSKSK